jgi:hypothetical protein
MMGEVKGSAMPVFGVSSSTAIISLSMTHIESTRDQPIQKNYQMR